MSDLMIKKIRAGRRSSTVMASEVSGAKKKMIQPRFFLTFTANKKLQQNVLFYGPQASCLGHKTNGQNILAYNLQHGPKTQFVRGTYFLQGHDVSVTLRSCL